MSLQLSSSLAASFALSASLALAQSTTPSAIQATITVAAASDLSSLEPALVGSFGKSQPQAAPIRVRFVTASSAILSQQIENGAPYDAFLSANAQFVDRLGSSGKLLHASIRTYAIGRVAILWRDGKHHPVSDLAANWVRFVALPNPKLAPYGVAAQQALEHAGLWKQVQPKVVYGENVRQTLQLFESGNADAVLTSDSLLIGKNPDLIPADWHQPIVQKAGIVSKSYNQEAAQKFIDFLLSPAGESVFAQFGFSRP